MPSASTALEWFAKIGHANPSFLLVFLAFFVSSVGSLRELNGCLGFSAAQLNWEAKLGITLSLGLVQPFFLNRVAPPVSADVGWRRTPLHPLSWAPLFSSGGDREVPTTKGPSKSPWLGCDS